MANCEKCGTIFTPSTDRTEVTSLRILCQPCEAERRSEKAKRAAGTAAAAAPVAPRPAARAVAPGASRSEASKAPEAAPPRPRPAAAPAPLSSPATSPKRTEEKEKTSGSIPRRSESRPIPSSGKRRPIPSRESLPSRARNTRTSPPARGLHGEPAKKLLHKPISGRDSDHSGDFHPDVQREVRILKQRESKVMTMAWIACGVLVVAAGGVALAARAKRNADVEAVRKHQEELADFLKTMSGFDLKTEAGANQALIFADTKKGIGWEDDQKTGSQVGSILTGARSSLDRIKERHEQENRLVIVETTLRDAASRTPDDLSRARRTIDTLEGATGADYPPDFESRVKQARSQIDRTLMTRLLEEAQALSKQAGEGTDKMRAALNAWTRAEREATNLLDRHVRGKDEDLKQYYTNVFKQVVEESNAFVSSVFTPEVIEKTPWTDLLTKEQKENWQNYGLEGFRIENGTLEIAGPVAGATANGLVAVPKAGGYRDFVVDMEFVLNKGVVDFLFRLGKRVDNTVESYPVRTSGENALKPGVSYRMEASFIGGKLNVVISPADSTDLTLESTWTKSRMGAFGAQIHEGTEMKITRLKIRELRNA